MADRSISSTRSAIWRPALAFRLGTRMGNAVKLGSPARPVKADWHRLAPSGTVWQAGRSVAKSGGFQARERPVALRSAAAWPPYPACLIPSRIQGEDI